VLGEKLFMEWVRNKFNYRVLIALSCFLFILIGDFNFLNTELSIYDSYSRSIVEDGDLNLSNQLFYKDDFRVVTNSGYFYTHHSYGNALISTPFFLYGKLLAKINGLEDTPVNDGLRGGNENLKPFNYLPNSSESFESFSMGVGVFLVFLLSFFSLLNLLSKELKLDGENKKLFEIYNYLILLAGPTFYYLFWGQSTPSLSIIVPLFFLFHFSRKKECNLSHFFFGVAFGVGVLIRVDFSLYALFVFYWWVKDSVGSTGKFAQFLGLSLSLIPFLVFENLRLGAVEVGYLETVYLNWLNILDFYFSPYKGVLFSHPIVLLIILGSVITLVRDFKKRKSSRWRNEFFIALLILIVKSILLSLTYSHAGGVLGPRQLIVDLLLVGVFFSKEIIFSRKIGLFLALLFFYNLIMSLIYAYPNLLNRPLFMVSDGVISFYQNYLKMIPFLLSKPLAILKPSNLANSVITFSVPVMIFYSLRRFKRKMIVPVMAYFIVSNILIVSLDFFSDKKVNSSEVRTTSMDALMYYENAGSMIERIRYLEGRQRLEEKEEFLVLLRSYFSKVKKDLGFSDHDMFKFFPLIRFDKNEEILKSIIKAD
jgi:hypothetical protein